MKVAQYKLIEVVTKEGVTVYRYIKQINKQVKMTTK
jgi:hypothetical protein